MINSSLPSSSPASHGSARRFLHHAVFWVPSLYLAMGIPFNVINYTASSMYKSLGVSDSQNTVALGSVILAWSLKPIWAAFLDMYRTKKFFVLAMESIIALLFAGVAMSLPLPGYFQITIALLWVASFASSTQDICGDGIYLTSLDKKTQANLAGIQGMFWNIGKVLATGLLISGAETLANSQGWSTRTMWVVVWITTGAVMALFALYHFFLLPTGSIEHRPHSAKQVVGDFLASATTFFHKRAFWGMIAFVFLYRLGEGLILTEGKLFIQSSTATGGLGLTAGQVANIDAVYGTIASIVGGILGGLFLGKLGLKRALPILGICLNVPHFTFVYLSHYGAAGHGLSYATIATMVSIEKFGYGFGFIGNMVYMMQQLAPGRCTMTHYAFATSLMNLVLAPTTMVSGPLAEWLGFSTFFLVVMFASVPSVLAAWMAPHPLGDATERRTEGEEGAVHIVTIDDPDRLTPAERAVQALAGRTSIYAMLNILTLLLLDAKLLGWIRDVSTGSGPVQFVLSVVSASLRFVIGPSDFLSAIMRWLHVVDSYAGPIYFALLIGSAVLKGFLTLRTFRLASQTAAEAAPHGETNYLGNARGAKIATHICTVVSLAILLVGAKLAF